ncbi:MAG TPA: S26 family signal peptidase, partial [Planctomycetota bacterium]|nr:S26 family signal peptidase [Planctomycetota bacterium]
MSGADGESPPPPAPTVAASRPAVLDLPPLAAAAQVAPEKPCPVCGSWLEKATASGSSGGLPGVPQPAARCSVCGFHSGPLVGRGAMYSRAIFIVGVGAVVAKLGLNFLHTKPIQGLLLLLAGVAFSPIFAWVDAKKTRRKLASRIAAARGRYTRDKEEQDFKIEPRELLAGARVGDDCPVCAKAKLEGMTPNPLWSRARLRCPRCRLDVPMAFTELGFVLSLAAAAVLVVGGALAVWHGRQFMGQGNDFIFWALAGLAVASAGLWLGFEVQGSGDDLALKELERSKRRFERRKRGLAVREDEEEPALWFQENLEAIVVAVILALIIRHFVMEAFVIPTGSMAPTLLGDHFQVQCKTCGYPFTVAKREGDINGTERVDARCPLCGSEVENEFHWPDVYGGNKILVNKFLYKFEPPERWNVIVFKYPNDPLKKNFIKRLIGLPGEMLNLNSRGDLRVKAPGSDRWVLARKPRSVQEEIWNNLPVYDSRYYDPRDQSWGPTPADRWVIERNPGVGETFSVRPGEGEATLEYKKEIRDNYGYNPAGHQSRGSNLMGDVRVRATVVPDKDCKAIRLSTVENGRVLTAEIPVGAGGEAVLTSSSATPTETEVHEIQHWKCAPLEPGKASEVALGYADERLSLVVNGEYVFEWEDTRPYGLTESSSVRIGCKGPGGARFERTRIDRDIFYLSQGSYNPGSGEGLLVPERCYFVMGDNSPNS